MILKGSKANEVKVCMREPGTECEEDSIYLCLSYITRQQLRRQKSSVSCHFIARHFHVRHSDLGKTSSLG